MSNYGPGDSGDLYDRDNMSDEYEGDLYDADMGNGVHGGSAQFDWHGGGRTHHSVYGSDHFSWDDQFDDGQWDDPMDVHGSGGFGGWGGG